MSTPKVHQSVQNTQVLSVRIPKNTIQHIDKLCKQKGINRSQWVADTIATQHADLILKKYKKGGGIQTSIVDEPMPQEVQDLLVGAGIITLGALVYKIVQELLIEELDRNGNQRFSANEQRLMTIALVASLGVSAYGIFKHISSE